MKHEIHEGYTKNFTFLHKLYAICSVEENKVKEYSKEELVNTIIIGASAAGLACAAALARKNIPYILLEKNNHIAGPWRAHYDRLHLNTEKWHSHLPYLPFPKSAAVYVPRDEVVEYMESYAARFNIMPVFNQQVQSLSKEDRLWTVKTADKRWSARHVIIATGLNGSPFIPSWPGVEEYQGKLFHSAVYTNGSEYKGKNVLVVGFGSSACEIAVCLSEHGAYPSMSVKGAVNVVPRDHNNVLVSRLLHKLVFVNRRFPEFIDRLNSRRLKKRYGFLEGHGLEPLPYGPNVQMVKHKKVPVLDVGTMALIRSGVIKICPGIKEFTPEGVRFTNGVASSFDAVIIATGYHSGLTDMLAEVAGVLDKHGRPLVSGRQSSVPGLFFCGFTVSPYGMLNQIGREAMNISREISSKSKNKISNRLTVLILNILGVSFFGDR